MKHSLLPLVLCLSFALPAHALDRAKLQSMLARAADGHRAAVLHVSTPAVAMTLTHGVTRPGGPPTTADDLFVLASISKPYLAAAILRLHERGLLDIDQRVTKYLHPATAKGFRSLDQISLRHLLGMRSGLPDYLDDRYLDRMIVRRAAPVTLQRALGYARGRRPLFRPDRQFDYSNTNYLLAQAALQRVTGQPMHQVFNKLLFRQTRLKQTWVINAPGSPSMTVSGFEDLFGDGPIDVTRYYHAPGFGDGGLIASAGDVARFFRALLIDKSILSPGGLRQMTRDPEGDRYGLGIDVEHHNDTGTVYGHSGGDLGFVSDVRVMPAQGIVVVALFASARANSAIAGRVMQILLR